MPPASATSTRRSWLEHAMLDSIITPYWQNDTSRSCASMADGSEEKQSDAIIAGTFHDTVDAAQNTAATVCCGRARCEKLVSDDGTAIDGVGSGGNTEWW